MWFVEKREKHIQQLHRYLTDKCPNSRALRRYSPFDKSKHLARGVSAFDQRIALLNDFLNELVRDRAVAA